MWAKTIRSLSSSSHWKFDLNGSSKGWPLVSFSILQRSKHQRSSKHVIKARPLKSESRFHGPPLQPLLEQLEAEEVTQSLHTVGTCPGKSGKLTYMMILMYMSKKNEQGQSGQTMSREECNQVDKVEQTMRPARTIWSCCWRLVQCLFQETMQLQIQRFFCYQEMVMVSIQLPKLRTFHSKLWTSSLS